MVFSKVFDRFVCLSPACVMHRAVMENVFAPAELDAMFRRTAVAQYERELLFSTLVDLLSNANFIRTWIFTAASSCARSGFRWKCSP